MSLKLEKFDGTKTYCFPNNALATPEIIRAQFPAVDHFTYVLELNGDVCQAVENLNALRQIHRIDPTLSEAEAIAAIEVIINTPPEVFVDEALNVQERIAAALELQNLLAMEDVVI